MITQPLTEASLLRARRADTRGLTLIELLITLAILAVLVTLLVFLTLLILEAT